MFILFLKEGGRWGGICKNFQHVPPPLPRGWVGGGGTYWNTLEIGNENSRWETFTF